MTTRNDAAKVLLVVGCLAVVFAAGGRWTARSRAAQAQNMGSYLPFIARPPALIVQPLGQGFSQVTAVTHAGDERVFVGQRNGEILAVAPNGSVTPFLDLRDRVVSNGSEYGLFDIAFHPDAPDNDQLFVTYTREIDQKIYLILGRFRVGGTPPSADPASEAVLLRIRQDTDLHKGGGLDFDRRDNWLYMGIGEDTQIALAQDAGSLKGKVVRLAVDDVPPDLAGNAEGRARLEIWALGFRNPWRVDVDEPSGLVLVADVGSGSWEEVNAAQADEAGVNFGWPCREGAFLFPPGDTVPACHTGREFADPLFAFSHEDDRCAIIGGSVYRPPANPSDGRFIFGDFCTSQVFALPLGTAAADPTIPLGIVSDRPLLTLGEGAGGRLYAGDSNASGPLYQLILP